MTSDHTKQCHSKPLELYLFSPQHFCFQMICFQMMLIPGITELQRGLYFQKNSLKIIHKHSLEAKIDLLICLKLPSVSDSIHPKTSRKLFFSCLWPGIRISSVIEEIYREGKGMNMRTSETGEIQANNTDIMFNNKTGERDEHNREQNK